MKWVIIVARILLGAPFLVFGLNGFFHFLPPPDTHAPDAQLFLDALGDTGYMFPLLKATEVFCGACLVFGIFVPLALTVLAPVLLNIVLFHISLDRQGLPMAGVLCALELFLAWIYRNNFWKVLAIRAKPSAADS